jgi:hypothetical protein
VIRLRYKSCGSRGEHQDVQFESGLHLRIPTEIRNCIEANFLLWTKPNKLYQISWLGEFIKKLKLEYPKFHY